LSDSEESKKGLLSGLKEKVGSVSDSVKDKVSDLKGQTQEHLEVAKEVGSEQLDNVKSEAEDLKRIFQSKDLIYKKTDAMAIVLRKLGNTDGFLEVVDKLTKEGYRLMHQETVRDIPIIAGFKYSFGSFYYFQHSKYIGK